MSDVWCLVLDVWWKSPKSVARPIFEKERVSFLVSGVGVMSGLMSGALSVAQVVHALT